MPVGWVAAAGLAGAAIQADAAGDAADTQLQGSRESSQATREMFDISRAQQQPYMQSGYAANDVLSRLMGLQPTAGRTMPANMSAGATGWQSSWDKNNGRLIGDTYLPPDVETRDVGNGWYEVHHNGQRVGTLRPGGPNGRFINDTGWQMPQPSATQSGQSVTGADIDPSTGYARDNTGLPTGFLTQLFGPEQFKANMDPGYQWRLQQGAQGVMNQSSVGGSSLSGPALKALMEYNQGAASQEYSNAFNRFQTQQGNIFQRLTSMAGLGQNAAAGVGNNAMSAGQTIGANIVGGANAAAAGQVGQANAWGSALSDLSSIGMWTYMNQKP